MKQLLIYTCCNKKYEDFIPLFCASHLYNNKDICIEIGIEGKLDENTKSAINFINSLYDNAVLIDENIQLFQNKHILPNTIRFLEQPKLIAEYVYISDIDIICMDKNICDIHIKHMNDIHKNYSNIVRKNKNSLTGLHFSKYDFYYPVNFEGINLSKNDEQILFDIVSKKCELDFETTFRPVHGIHMSPSRISVKGDNKIPGWDAENFKQEWIAFCKTDLYKNIEPYFNSLLKDQINKLNKFYNE